MGKILRFKQSGHEFAKKKGAAAVKRNVAAFAADSDGRYVFVNSHWSRLAGLNQDGALGDGWLQAIHPGDRKEVSRQWKAAVEGERFFGLLYRIRGAKRGDRWVLNQAIPQHEEDGDLAGYSGTIVDVSDLSSRYSDRSSATHLRVILDFLALGYYEQDLVTGEVSCSPSCFDLIGGARTVQDYDALLHPEDLPEVNQLFNRCIEEGTLFQAEYRIAVGRQEWTRVKDYAKIVYADDGTPSHAIGLMAPADSFTGSKEEDGVTLLCRLAL